MGPRQTKVKSKSAEPKILETPWCYVKKEGTLFTEENEEKMRKGIPESFSVPNMKRANIQVLGPVGAGKSSFINSVATVNSGRYTAVSQTGQAVHSYTFKHTRYTPDRGSFQNFAMLDCMGIQSADGGFNVNDVLYLVDGHAPKNYLFNPAKPLTKDDPQFIQDPDKNSKIHCVVYVIDANTLSTTIPTPLKDKIINMQDRLKEKGAKPPKVIPTDKVHADQRPKLGAMHVFTYEKPYRTDKQLCLISKDCEIPRVVILTHIDKVCKEINDDVAMTFRSSEIRDAVNLASELFKLPKLNVFPVKNYADNWELCHKTNVLILLALESILNLSEDYLLQQIGEDND